MRVFIGADHRGYRLKEETKVVLRSLGHEVVDEGTYEDGPSCDYPDISLKVAKAVASSPGSRGILVCMTGIGHTIAANKVPGAYAALCYNQEAAVLSREHNDANILILGAKFVPEADMPGIIKVWLGTAFAGGRHLRRVEKIKDIEKSFLKSGHSG